ncbi:MAG: 2-hydroxychromene-2-carboxylate isomerase [Myxococcales bacterium]|nr:2-hydroxychromene-2-carboxylate isomerase [Myxococcales bacterium]
MATLEFFFDCSSPWTYLAFHEIEAIASETRADLVWRPFLVGGVFNTVNPSVYQSRETPVPAKARYMRKDLADWARHRGIEIGWPEVFPVNSVKAMRGAFVAIEEGCIGPYARAVFERYWGQLDDISQEEVMRDIVRGVGLDEEKFFEKISSPEYKTRLRENTEELIARGGFGTPTMFVNESDMYFGQDRLELVRAALAATGS